MKEKKNYIDNIPRINDMKWEVLEDGIVEITVENTGFYNKVAQRLFKNTLQFYKLENMEVLCGSRLTAKKVYMKLEKNLEISIRVLQISYMKDFQNILEY